MEDIRIEKHRSQIHRHIVRAFGNAVFTRTRARTVSQSLFGRFSYPKLLPNDSDTRSNVLVECAATAWDDLAANTADGTKPFLDIHSLLFFLELLGLGRELLFRGQVNAKWGLESTLTRKVNEGWDLATIEAAKASFVDAVHNLPDCRHLKLVDDESEALCQHYGFPTHFLDFTWSLDVGAFFAIEGLYDEFEMGSLWVVDIMGKASDDIVIVTLGRGFMRPALQRGEFLRFAKDADASVIKFLFRHDPDAFIDSLYDLGPGTIPIAAYLKPARDPVAEVSRRFLEELNTINRRMQ